MKLSRTLLTAMMTAVVGAALAGCGTAATTAVTRTTPAGSGARPAGAGAQRAGVPWSEVGAGWVLAQYVSAQPEGGKSGPVTLYLISPDGTRYKVAHWPNSRTSPQLVAWSPDGKRALFQIFSGKGGTEG